MIEWIGDTQYCTLKINNITIGRLNSYNDCDEDFGWVFSWSYGIIEYDFEPKYFSVSETEMLWFEFENVKKRVLSFVKDVIGHEYLELKHLYKTLDKNI